MVSGSLHAKHKLSGILPISHLKGSEVTWGSFSPKINKTERIVWNEKLQVRVLTFIFQFTILGFVSSNKTFLGSDNIKQL